MRAMTHLSLFSGIGGLDLAAEAAGFITVGQCEWADYPTKVLEKHWPDVPRWRDIRTMTGESFYEKTGLRTVDVISGGFPCQPFSQAGKQRGKEDDRYLWPEMCRVIAELRPAWVLCENVPGIINLALDQVLLDLENLGYSAQAFVIPACGVDAPHKRDRVCIVAHANDKCAAVRRDGKLQDAGGDGAARADHGGREEGVSIRERREDESSATGMVDGLRAAVYQQVDPDADTHGLPGRGAESVLDSAERERERERDGSARLRRDAEKPGGQPFGEDWLPEPELDRVVDGIPNRVDRIKSLGNAVVPQQFYPFFAAIAAVEAGRKKI